MRIVFIRTDIGWKIMEDQEYQGGIPDYRTFVRLRKKMKELFPSIMFFRVKDHYDADKFINLTFRDKADEDHFIVWSSDGVEV